MQAQSIKQAYDDWLLSKTPFKGEFRALLCGVALGAIFHEVSESCAPCARSAKTLSHSGGVGRVALG